MPLKYHKKNEFSHIPWNEFKTENGKQNWGWKENQSGQYSLYVNRNNGDYEEWELPDVLCRIITEESERSQVRLQKNLRRLLGFLDAEF